MLKDDIDLKVTYYGGVSSLAFRAASAQGFYVSCEQAEEFDFDVGAYVPADWCVSVCLQGAEILDGVQITGTAQTIMEQMEHRVRNLYEAYLINPDRVYRREGASQILSTSLIMCAPS